MHNDVVKALEAAEEAIEDQMASDDNDVPELARAAVLAFVKAMPDGWVIDIPTRATEMYIPLTPSRISAELEKET